MNTGKVPLYIFFFIIANDLLDTTAQLLMKKGIGHPDVHVLMVAAGLSMYVLIFFLWMKILSQVELSVALPLGSLSYVLVPIAANVFLHEHIGFARRMGLVLILAGIYAVSQSKPKKVKMDSHV